MCKAHRLVYHSTLGLRVIKKKKPGPTARVVTRCTPGCVRSKVGAAVRENPTDAGYRDLGV